MARFPINIVLCLLAAAPLSAQLAPALLPMRDWTSDDGRTIRAEVLGLEGDSVQFRLDGGQRAAVPEARLSLPDRAELVRYRFREQTRISEGEAANTNYHYSLLTPQEQSHTGIVGLISVGPSRFLFELKIHSQTVDLRTYDRIHLATGDGSEAIHSYNSAQSWKSGTEETTRVVVQIPPPDPAKFVPVLVAGLAEDGGLELSASRAGAERVALPMSENERAALADLLSLYARAQPLVVEGVIRREPLDSQDFAAAVASTPPAPSPSDAPGNAGAAGAMAEPPPELTPEEKADLTRMASGRGGGRFGEIVWTAPGAAPRTVNGLGWMRDRVVVREGDGAPVLVPFSEIEPGVRGKMLQRRLSESAGNHPPQGPLGTLYYPQGWSEHQRKTRQGLLFGVEKGSGRPILILQGHSSQFQGAGISELAIRGNLAPGYVAVPIRVTETRTEQRGDTPWSFATVALAPTQAAEMAKLAGGRALDIRITSGEDSSTFPLANEHLETSLEALRCYHWATLVP